MPAKKEPQTPFGQRLTALRKHRGLTQVQLARALGTSQRAISYYETQADLPPGPAVVALARTLRVSADELLGLRPARAAADSIAGDQRLWKRFRRMAAHPNAISAPSCASSAPLPVAAKAPDADALPLVAFRLFQPTATPGP